MFIRNRDTEIFGRWSDSRNVERMFALGLFAFGFLLAGLVVVGVIK